LVDRAGFEEAKARPLLTVTACGCCRLVDV
jgi:hypothetical protein